VLVALIVALDPVAGAVKFPFVSIDPLSADHVTDLSKFPVPVTVAEHCSTTLFPMEGKLHETATPEIVVKVRVAVPDFVESCWLVAVTVALDELLEAVNAPLWSMEPPVAVQVIAEL